MPPPGRGFRPFPRGAFPAGSSVLRPAGLKGLSLCQETFGGPETEEGEGPTGIEKSGPTGIEEKR